MHHHPGLAAACALALAACGGGEAPPPLAADVALGYAADATTLPPAAATGVEAAVGALEAALGRAALPEAGLVALAGQASGDAACLRGGSLAWTVSGGQQLANARLDAGETWTISYDGCVTGDHGPTIDGAVSLSVAASGGGRLELHASTPALAFAQGELQIVLGGAWQAQRSSVTTPVGGIRVSGRISSRALSLASSTATSHARYALRALDWTVVRTYDAEGRLGARSHEGTLGLAASSPRRPEATLAVATDGALAVGADGLVSAGRVSVDSGRDRLVTQHGGGSVTVSVDRDHDGSVERRWTLPRQALADLAG